VVCVLKPYSLLSHNSPTSVIGMFPRRNLAARIQFKGIRLRKESSTEWRIGEEGEDPPSIASSNLARSATSSSTLCSPNGSAAFHVPNSTHSLFFSIALEPATPAAPIAAIEVPARGGEPLKISAIPTGTDKYASHLSALSQRALRLSF
jgi:hypothetical protein